MPELPEIQVMRDRIEDGGLHRTVTTVSFRPDGMETDVSGSTLRDALLGHRLVETSRHGKQLFVRSGEERGRWLRLHFGMTGTVETLETGNDEPDHVRLRLDFEGGRSLAFVCPRKFGGIDLVEDPAAWVESEGLGPDPLREDFGLSAFRDRLDGRRGTVKGALMNQEIIAGVGNLYSDEALFQSGIHPETSVDDLGPDRIEDLWRSLKRVLEETIEVRAQVDRMPESWLRPHRSEGDPCPRCDGEIEKIEVSGRPTYLCGSHQER